MAIGWIKLHRDARDHEVFQDPDVWRLFCWCLLKANYIEASWHGQRIAAGSFVTGRNIAADELQISPSKWYRGIERLVALGCITVRSNSNWTTVTICNWSTYQSDEQQKRTANGQPLDSERTANEQQMNTNKEIKNLRTEEINPPLTPQGGNAPNGSAGEKKGKSRNPKSLTKRTADFERWYALYPKRVGVDAAAKAFATAMKRIEERHVDREAALNWLISVTGVFADSPKGRGKYCWNPSTFLNQGHYDDDQSQWQHGDGADKSIHAGPGQLHPDDDKGF